MTLDRPADLSDLQWSRLLASNTIEAQLSQEPSGWVLQVFAKIYAGQGTSLAEIELNVLEKPAESAVDEKLVSLGLCRIGDWEEVEGDENEPMWFFCHLTLPPSQIAEGRAFTEAEERSRAQQRAQEEHKQKVANFGTWRGWTIFLALTGGFLNLLALAPFPAADYRLFRFGICAAAVVLIFLVGSHKSWGWLVVLLPAAVLWNPIFQFYFDRSTWAPLNIVAVVGFAALAYWAVHQKAPPAPEADYIGDVSAKGNSVDQP